MLKGKINEEKTLYYPLFKKFYFDYTG